MQFSSPHSQLENLNLRKFKIDGEKKKRKKARDKKWFSAQEKQMDEQLAPPEESQFRFEN